MSRAKRLRVWFGATRYRRWALRLLWPLVALLAALELGALEILTNMLWAQGLLLAMASAFYLFSTHFEAAPLAGRDRYLIARSIGWVFAGIAFGSLAGGWSGGVRAYALTYDAHWLAWLSLGVRTFTLFHLFRLLYLSIRLWVLHTPTKP